MKKPVEIFGSKEVTVKMGAEWANIASMVTKHQNQAEEECLTKVLTAYLEREPTDDDFMNCTQLVNEGNVNQYVLAHLDVKLGMITRSFVDDNGTPTFRVEFEPRKLEFDV